MKLADLRRLAIRKQLKIHFRLRNGMECVVNEDGIAQVPALRGVPDFNLEEELGSADDFLVEPRPPAPPKKANHAELSSMASSAPAAAHHEHEEE